MYKVLEAPSPNNNIKMQYDYHKGKIYYFAGSALAQDSAIPKKRGRVADAISTFTKSLNGMSEDSRNAAIDAFFAALDASDPDQADQEDPADLEHIKLGLAKAKDEPGPNPDPSSRWVEKGRAEQAADGAASATESFASRYPTAMEIRLDPYGKPSPAPRHKTPSAAERESFAQRNPEAMKIRVYK